MLPEICEAILFFQAFTGCDISESLMGIGKKTAWIAWMDDNAVTETMAELTTNLQMFNEDSDHMKRLEQFTVRFYSKHCSHKTSMMLDAICSHIS